MATPIIIAADEVATVVLSDNDSSLAVKSGIRIDTLNTGYGVDATFGFGGSISVYGSIEGTWGVYDGSGIRASYDVYVHAGAAITSRAFIGSPPVGSRHPSDGTAAIGLAARQSANQRTRESGGP